MAVTAHPTLGAPPSGLPPRRIPELHGASEWSECCECGADTLDDPNAYLAHPDKDEIVGPLCDVCFGDLVIRRRAQLQGASVAEQAQTAVDRLRAQIVRGLPAIRAIPPRSPLVNGVLDLDSFVVLYGRSGGGKSFTAIDLALHVATGSWWYGHRVKQGPVLYVVAEGDGGIAARINAWALQNRYHGTADDFAILPRAVNLLDPVASQTLAVTAAETDPVLVVVDTLNRSMPGGDENASRDMGLAIAAADAIRAATGACVLYVHHSGKDTTAGARGHSSLLGAVDTELELKSADGIITFSTTKQKDKPGGDQPMRFVLAPHTWTCTACDGDDDECETCGGIGTLGSAAIAPYRGQHTGVDDDQKALDALTALTAVDVPGGVPSTVWLEAATAENSVRSPMVRSTFFEKRKVLIESGKVRQIGEGRAARYTLPTRDNAE